MKKIIVVKQGDAFVLRTALGAPIGERLITNAAAPGKNLPPMEAAYHTEIAAMRAALAWNVYFKEKPCRTRNRKSKI